MEAVIFKVTADNSAGRLGDSSQDSEYYGRKTFKITLSSKEIDVVLRREAIAKMGRNNPYNCMDVISVERV